MYGSHSARSSEDLNLPCPLVGSFSGQRTTEAESDLLRRQQQQQMSSGLLQYRSALSSLLSEVCEDFLPIRASSLEIETMFSWFLVSDLHDDRTVPPVVSPSPVASLEIEAMFTQFFALDFRDEAQDGPSGGAVVAFYTEGQRTIKQRIYLCSVDDSPSSVSNGRCQAIAQRRARSGLLWDHLTMEAAQLKHRDFDNSSNLIKHGDFARSRSVRLAYHSVCR